MYIILLADRRGLGLPMGALGSHRGSWRIVARIVTSSYFRSESEAREVATDFNQSQSKWRAIVFREDLALSDPDSTLHRRAALSPSDN